MPDFNAIAAKWQKKWEDSRIFEVIEYTNKKKFYCLEMYPYPSGSGLHMGHARNYCIGDSYARFKRMQGYNVLYPMGYDSFGLPAENAAIKAKSHPKIFTENAIKNFIRQQKKLGLSYDWSRMIMSHDPKYYKWDQWIFIKLFEKGLAYKKKAAVNWCPECNTVLANEQVHDGKCWRHAEARVELRELSQWFFKITDYAEELLNKIDKLDWNEDVKIMQRNWIGKSYGTLVNFPLKSGKESIPIFTTRVDTLFGVTFMVFAPEHPKVIELVKGTEYEDKVKKFISKVILEDRFTRTAEEKEKEGMFIGRYAINPVTKKEIPIYIANFVLMDYGTGAIMAVPTHDQRDFEFAKKYNIPLKVVISPSDCELNPEKMSRAYIDDGIMVNSGKFDGLNNRDAIEEINKFLEEEGIGKKTVQYKLRDWLVSRQRFWGCPIPIIYCNKCGITAVPEKELPIRLPEKVDFGGKGNPLESCEEFVNTSCPKCGGKAKRETDTMDTFVDSSWYFLRYCDANNDDEIFDEKKVRYWMPIDQYIGGKEHATMHLIYFRFFTKFLRDIGLLKFDEPATKLFNQGMLHKGGVVMSKSRGNVVVPEEVAEKYGIDTARLFLLFVAGPDKDMEWSDEGVEGSFRFIKKFYSLISEKEISIKPQIREISRLHRTIKETTESIENLKFNIAIIKLMEFTNYLNSIERISKESSDAMIKMMALFTPHICEELWEMRGNTTFVSLEGWPKHDESKIDLRAEAMENIVMDVRGDINSVLKLVKIDKPKKISLFVADSWKYLFFEKLKQEIEKTHNAGEIIKRLMRSDLKKYGQEISKLVPKFLKDSGKIPEILLSEVEEFDALTEGKAFLEKEFGCPVEILKEAGSKEAKAKQSMPGKPGVLVI